MTSNEWHLLTEISSNQNMCRNLSGQPCVFRRDGGCAEGSNGDADHDFCSSNSAKLKCGDHARAKEINLVEIMSAF